MPVEFGGRQNGVFHGEEKWLTNPPRAGSLPFRAPYFLRLFSDSSTFFRAFTLSLRYTRSE